MRWRVCAGDRFTGCDRGPGSAMCQSCTPATDGGLVTENAGSRRPGWASSAGSSSPRPAGRAADPLAADHAPLVVPPAAEVRGRREATEAPGGNGARRSPTGADRELVLRSALALKLLTYSPTGAMAAAATTSLPERIGGERNYDYRYGWIRDTSFVLDSFIQLGLTQEVQGTLAWMLSCISATAPVSIPSTGCAGTVPDCETEAPAARLP